MASPALLIPLLLLTIAAVVRPANADAHPQDGPHADVRVIVQDQAIRQNMLINLAMLDAIAPTTRETPAAVEGPEIEALREAVMAYFTEQNWIKADGVEIEPQLLEFEVVRGDPKLLPLFPRSGLMGLVRVQMVLEYPLVQKPRKIEFYWDTYPPDTMDIALGDLAPVEIQLQAEGRVKILQFTPEEPGFVWRTQGITLQEELDALPEPTDAARPRTGAGLVMLLGVIVAVGGLAGLVLARGTMRTFGGGAAAVGAALAGLGVSLVFRTTDEINPATAQELFGPLHENIYRAFDFQSESDIYDALARSVEGDLLDTLYSQVYLSLVLQEEGGALSRVTEYEPITTEFIAGGEVQVPGGEARPGFTIQRAWEVEGTVYHWGHSHVRRNAYEAEYTVAKTDAGWRIVHTRMLRQERIDDGTDTPSTMPEGLDPEAVWQPGQEL